MEIRKATITDADKLINLFTALDSETAFMLMEPGESQLTAEKQIEIISAVEKSNSRVLLVAHDKNKLVGFLGGTGGLANRNRHSIHIAMGVLASHCGKKIGTKLLEALLLWAAQSDFHRVELTVIENNHRAKALYKKLGFEFEGIKHNALLINGNYVNEHYMAKLI